MIRVSWRRQNYLSIYPFGVGAFAQRPGFEFLFGHSRAGADVAGLKDVFGRGNGSPLPQVYDLEGPGFTQFPEFVLRAGHVARVNGRLFFSFKHRQDADATPHALAAAISRNWGL